MNGFGREVALEVGIGGAGLRGRCAIAELEDVAVSRLPAAVQIRGDEIAPSSRRRRRRTSRGSSIALRIAARPRPPRAGRPASGRDTASACALLGRLAHGDQAQRALLAHHLAGVGDPRRVVSRRTPSRRGTPEAAGAGAAHQLAPADLDVTGALRSVAGSKTSPLMLRARHEAAVARAAATGSATAPAARQLAALGARAAGVCDRRASGGVPSSAPAIVDRAGAGIERELERVQREGAVHAARSSDARGRGRAEQRHLQAAVLRELEPVVGRERLADGEADLLAAVVDAAPLRPSRSARGRSRARAAPGRTSGAGARPSAAPRRGRRAPKAGAPGGRGSGGKSLTRWTARLGGSFGLPL